MESAKKPTEQPPLPRGPHAISADDVAADQRRRLLEALPRAVAEHGLEATTVEHIVKLAQVRRNSFYEQFEDKQHCLALAYEIAQERLLGVLTFQCYTRAGLADRVGSALRAALELLAAEPVLARLLFVEASAAGEVMAVRHHQWLDRYGRMLGLAVIGSPDVAKPPVGVEPAIVGGIVSRVKQLVLAGEAAALPRLCPELVQFTLSFYGSREPVLASVERNPLEPEPPQPQSSEPASVLEPV